MNCMNRTNPTPLNVRCAAPRTIIVTAVLLLGVFSSACKDGSSSAEQSATMATAHSHTQAGDTCVICDPSKREPGRLWCKEHGRYEDRCWDCQPQLRDANRPYCEEHGLYEDECFLCDPSRRKAANKPNPQGGGR